MKITAIIIACFFFVVSSAFATTMDGNEFIEMYNKKDVASRQYLLGYLAGWYDQTEIDIPSLPKCLGTDVKMSQLVDTVALYLEKHPEVRHLHPSSFIPTAIKTQFGCK